MLYRLDLTDEQAETLGYALTIAARTIRARRDQQRADRRDATLSNEQYAAVEELRTMLDCCPQVKG